MQISFIRASKRALPSACIELLVAVDSKIVRTAIDWAVIRHFIGEGSGDEALVSDFMRKNKQKIEVAIKAHLFAHGVPLDRHLVLTLDDFEHIRDQVRRDQS